MEYIKKAKELFEIMIQTGKSLPERTRICAQGEIGTLLYLTSEKDGISTSELADGLKVSLPRVVALLNTLENKQLVKKVIDKEDKRKSIIYVTEKGKLLMEEKKNEVINNMVKVLEKIDEKDVEQYIELHKKIQKVIMDMQE